jgi:hypothetical protein
LGSGPRVHRCQTSSGCKGPGGHRQRGSPLYAGFVYAEDRHLMLINDRSGRRDVYPWRLPIGPVLRLKVIKGLRRRVVPYRHPDWTKHGVR